MNRLIMAAASLVVAASLAASPAAAVPPPPDLYPVWLEVPWGEYQKEFVPYPKTVFGNNFYADGKKALVSYSKTYAKHERVLPQACYARFHYRYLGYIRASIEGMKAILRDVKPGDTVMQHFPELMLWVSSLEAEYSDFFGKDAKSITGKSFNVKVAIKKYVTCK